MNQEVHSFSIEKWQAHLEEVFKDQIQDEEQALPLLQEASRIAEFYQFHGLESDQGDECARFFLTKLAPSVCSSIVKAGELR